MGVYMIRARIGTRRFVLFGNRISSWNGLGVRPVSGFPIAQALFKQAGQTYRTGCCTVAASRTFIDVNVTGVFFQSDSEISRISGNRSYL